MIRAIAFDMDDTLYPEEEYVHSGYRAVSEAVNKKFGFRIYADLVEMFKAGKHHQAFELALLGHSESVSESYLLSLVQVYREHQPELHPFPEVVAVLEKLKARYRLALISDGYEEVQERKLQGLNLRYGFEAVIFSDRWGREFWKPNVRPFQECARSLDLDPGTMVYVGDNPAKDFVGARKAGMITVRVRRPGTLHHLEEPESGFESDREIGGLNELPPLLCAISEQPATAG